MSYVAQHKLFDIVCGIISLIFDKNVNYLSKWLSIFQCRILWVWMSVVLPWKILWRHLVLDIDANSQLSLSFRFLWTRRTDRWTKRQPPLERWAYFISLIMFMSAQYKRIDKLSIPSCFTSWYIREKVTTVLFFLLRFSSRGFYFLFIAIFRQQPNDLNVISDVNIKT